jgi:2-desacetyl-2-hydroxyethyl bacteriochlorophyllide A dehydrogenase
MKAAVLHKIGMPLVVEDVKEPKINSQDVLIKVKACGICHSDLHLIDGTLRVGKLPIILGHEAVGVVAEVGEEVVDFAEGEKVVIYFYFSCGKCANCRRGQDNLCNKMLRFGMDVDGAFAEYAKVPAHSLVKLPNEIEFIEGALLGCAVGASYHALKDVGRLRIGETIVIYGIGGLGMSAVQIAKLCGAHVIAVDIRDEKLRLAQKLGADATINSKKENLSQKIRKLTDGEGADLSIELVGLPETINQAIDSIKKGGRAILVGFSSQNVSINPNDVIVRNIAICGSRGLWRQNLVELVQLIKSKKLDLKPLITRRVSLEEINVGVNLLRDGTPVRVIVRV